MPERIAEYARLAAEALMAASRETDREKSALLRQQGYNFVDLLRAEEVKNHDCD